MSYFTSVHQPLDSVRYQAFVFLIVLASLLFPFVK